MTETFVNDAQTTINQAGGIGASDVSFTVTDASEFPSTGEFRVRVDNELMLVTNVTGTTFTVTRSIESTAAVAHSNGAYVTAVFTAAAANALQSSSHIPMAASLCKASVSNATTSTVTCGSCYISYSQVFTAASCKLRVIMDTTNAAAGYEAYVDLYDEHGQLNAGTPAVVTGSQIDTGSGVIPPGAPASIPTTPSLYEIDLYSAIIGGAWVGDIAVFSVRLWVGTVGATATCYSAELVFE